MNQKLLESNESLKRQNLPHRIIHALIFGLACGALVVALFNNLPMRKIAAGLLLSYACLLGLFAPDCETPQADPKENTIMYHLNKTFDHPWSTASFVISFVMGFAIFFLSTV